VDIDPQRFEEFRKFLIESRYRPGDPVPDEFVDLLDILSRDGEGPIQDLLQSQQEAQSNAEPQADSTDVNASSSTEASNVSWSNSETGVDVSEPGASYTGFNLPLLGDESKVAFKLTNVEMIQDSIEIDIKRIETLADKLVITDLVPGGFLRSMWCELLTLPHIPPHTHRAIIRSLAGNVREILAEVPDITGDEFTSAVKEIVYEEAERNCQSQKDILKLFFYWAFLTNGPVQLPGVPGKCRIVGRAYSDARNEPSVSRPGRRRTLVVVYKSDEPQWEDTYVLARYVIGNHSLKKQSYTLESFLANASNSDDDVEAIWNERFRELDEKIKSMKHGKLPFDEEESKTPLLDAVSERLDELKETVTKGKEFEQRWHELERQEEDAAWLRIMKHRGHRVEESPSRSNRVDPSRAHWGILDEPADETPLEDPMDPTPWLQNPYALAILRKSTDAEQIREVFAACYPADPEGADVMEAQTTVAMKILSRRIFAYYHRPVVDLSPDPSQQSDFSAESLTPERVNLLRQTGVEITDEDLQKLREEDEPERRALERDYKMLGLDGASESELREYEREWEGKLKEKLAPASDFTTNVDAGPEPHASDSTSSSADSMRDASTEQSSADQNKPSMEDLPEIVKPLIDYPISDEHAEMAMDAIVSELYSALETLYNVVDSRGGRPQSLDPDEAEFSAQELYETLITVPAEERSQRFKLELNEGKSLSDLVRGVSGKEHVVADFGQYPVLQVFWPLLETVIPTYMHIETSILLVGRLIESFSVTKIPAKNYSILSTELIAVEACANALAGYALSHLEITSFVFSFLPPLGSFVRIPGMYGALSPLGAVYVDNRKHFHPGSRVHNIGYPVEGPGTELMLIKQPVLRATQFTKLRVRDGEGAARQTMTSLQKGMQHILTGQRATPGDPDDPMLELEVFKEDLTGPELDPFMDTTDPSKFAPTLRRCVDSLDPDERYLTVIVFYASTHHSMEGKLVKATYLFDEHRLRTMTAYMLSETFREKHFEHAWFLVPNFAEIVDMSELCDNRALDPIQWRLQRHAQLPDGVTKDVPPMTPEEAGEHQDHVWMVDSESPEPSKAKPDFSSMRQRTSIENPTDMGADNDKDAENQ